MFDSSILVDQPVNQDFEKTGKKHFDWSILRIKNLKNPSLSHFSRKLFPLSSKKKKTRKHKLSPLMLPKLNFVQSYPKVSIFGPILKDKGCLLQLFGDLKRFSWVFLNWYKLTLLYISCDFV